MQFPTGSTTLGRPIVHIVRQSAQPKMSGIHTGRVVPSRAVMKHAHIRRYGAKGQFIGQTVSTCGLPTQPQVPITVLVLGAGPYPALVGRGLVYPGPKALLSRGVSVAVLMTRTETTTWFDKLAATARAEGNCGRISLHGEPPIHCAVPLAAPTVQGHLCASIIAHLFNHYNMRLAATRRHNAMSPQGYDIWTFRRLCAQRERYRRGLLNEQTMDSLRLRFGRWLFEHGVVNENLEGEKERHAEVSQEACGG